MSEHHRWHEIMRSLTKYAVGAHPVSWNDEKSEEICCRSTPGVMTWREVKRNILSEHLRCHEMMRSLTQYGVGAPTVSWNDVKSRGICCRSTPGVMKLWEVWGNMLSEHPRCHEMTRSLTKYAVGAPPVSWNYEKSNKICCRSTSGVMRCWEVHRNMLSEHIWCHEMTGSLKKY